MDELRPGPGGLPGSQEDRRRRRILFWVHGILLAVALGGLIVLQLRTPHQAPVAAPTDTAAVPQSADGSPTASPSPSPSPGYDDCAPGDLDPQPRYVDDAGGSLPTTSPLNLASMPGEHVVIRNAGRRTCALRVAPVLRYTDGAGQVRTVDADPATFFTGGQDQPLVLLAPGGYAQLVFLNMALAGSGPAPPVDFCTTMTDWQGMSVLLAGGRPYPLPGLRVSHMCPRVTVTPWLALDDPASMGTVRLLPRATGE